MQVQHAYVEGEMNAGDEILAPALQEGLDDAPALTDERGSLSYRQLDRLANRFGNALCAHDLRPEDRVMFLLEDCNELVAAYIGTLRIGAVAVAYNRRAAPRDLIFTINESRARVLMVEADFLPMLDQIRDQLHHDPLVVVNRATDASQLSIETLLEGQSEQLVSTPMSPDDMAFWIYTSGTTGKPKAAVHLHHDVLVSHLHLKENFQVGPGDRILCTSKLFFAYPLAHGIFAGLRCGANVILFDGWPNPALAGELVERHRPTLLFSVPTFYRKMLDDGIATGAAFKQIRCCVSAGERLPEPLFEEWQQTTGQPILEGIGTTETLVLYIANTPQAYRPGASGRVLPWAEVRLTDEEGKAITTPNTPGVAWLRMPSICDRYWNRQDQTRNAFQGIWYRTGDMFRFDEQGWWYHQGRADHMLKISGQWVSPTEIESCALAIPAVADAAVVEMRDGNGLSQIVLFIEPKPGDVDEALAQQVKQRLYQQLAHFKCPNRVLVVPEFQRTATGKVQKYKLQALLEEVAIPA